MHRNYFVTVAVAVRCKTLHLPQLHLYRSATGYFMYVIYGGYFIFVYFIYSMFLRGWAVVSLYSTKTKHINTAMYITMLNSLRVVMAELF